MEHRVPSGDLDEGEVTLHKGDTLWATAPVELGLGGFGFGRLVIRWRHKALLEAGSVPEAQRLLLETFCAEARAMGIHQECAELLFRHSIAPGIQLLESGRAGEELAALGIKPAFQVDAPGR